MRGLIVFACVIGVICWALAQQPSIAAPPGESKAAGSEDAVLRNFFEVKVKVEWEAIKNKDKKTYGDLLADDYEGVENDGRGERTKMQAINEMTEQNIYNYTLWGFKFIPLGSDATFVVYEVTMQFPPRAQVRFARVYIGELWVKRGSEWKLLHYQETHVK
jgi:hypothetical protein